MKRYTDLFVDFDDTIYDTHGNADVALDELFALYGLDEYFDDRDYFHINYWKTNNCLWDMYAQGQLDRDFLIVERFRRPLMLGRNQQGEPFLPSLELCRQMSDSFLSLCSEKSATVPDAHEVMSYLKEKGYRIHMCSNGFHEVQYKKMKASQLDVYFDTVVLSEDAGANKPSPEFFHYAFKKTSAIPATTVMIGDNYRTDIAGASGVCIDTIFFNRNPESLTISVPSTIEIRALKDLYNIL